MHEHQAPVDDHIVSSQQSDVTASFDGSGPFLKCEEMISSLRNRISGPIQKYLEGLQRIREMQYQLVAPPFDWPLPTLWSTLEEESLDDYYINDTVRIPC
eukprot:5965102-Karenia_brevis.AAC.1